MAGVCMLVDTISNVKMLSKRSKTVGELIWDIIRILTILQKYILTVKRKSIIKRVKSSLYKSDSGVTYSHYEFTL